MIARPRYYFKKELRTEFLDGRTMSYVAKKLDASPSFIGMILRGEFATDDFIIHKLLEIIGHDGMDIEEQKNYFFIEK